MCSQEDDTPGMGQSGFYFSLFAPAGLHGLWVKPLAGCPVKVQPDKGTYNKDSPPYGHLEETTEGILCVICTDIGGWRCSARQKKVFLMSGDPSLKVRLTKEQPPEGGEAFSGIDRD